MGNLCNSALPRLLQLTEPDHPRQESTDLPPLHINLVPLRSCYFRGNSRSGIPLVSVVMYWGWC
jgi:hypothetical protein